MAKLETFTLLVAMVALLVAGGWTSTSVYGFPAEPVQVKTREEERLARVIAHVYDAYVQTRTIGGQELRLRVPFGQQGERFPAQSFFRGGKASPQEAWSRIDNLLATDDFRAYVRQLSQPGEKLILLRLRERRVEVIFDPARIAATQRWCLGNERYPCRPKKDAVISTVNVYDYLYAMGVGIDCSGFTSRVLERLVALYGVNLADASGIPMTSFGTWVYRMPRHVTPVDDRIIKLRPGDLALFNCWKRPVCHSAIIGEVNLHAGWLIIYQSTDWVDDFSERGVHAMRVFFDPEDPYVSLADPRLRWEQAVGPVFPEEFYPYQDQDYGYRYRTVGGGGRVVRLNLLVQLIEDVEPQYYQTLPLKGL